MAKTEERKGRGTAGQRQTITHEGRHRRSDQQTEPTTSDSKVCLFVCVSVS